MAAPADSIADALRDRDVLDEPARGGMGTVYLARDPVAPKVLHPDLAARLGPERFLREARLTASLLRPHILPVRDSGEAVGQLWYTIPHVESGTITSDCPITGPAS